MNKIIIAIDGHSATGKSSTAKVVAAKLGYIYLDSGAMYRATTLYFLQHHVSLTNPTAIKQALNNIVISFKPNTKGITETYLNHKNVEAEIRSMEVSNFVSEVSAIKAVRTAMVALQRQMSKQKGIVMDGRDIGSVVFPEAELKIFMTASPEVRAKRRQKELEEKGQKVSFEEILANVQERDRKDSTRSESPLVKVADAIEIDNSTLRFKEQTDRILELANKIINA